MEHGNKNNPLEELSHNWAINDQLPSHNDHCMVCGSLSPQPIVTGPFTVLKDEKVRATVRFDSTHHQGAPAYAHGGAVAALLDDAMGYMSFLLLQLFVTAHLEVEYRSPVLLNHDYFVTAWLEKRDGRKIHLAAKLHTKSETIAEGSGLFLAVNLEHFEP